MEVSLLQHSKDTCPRQVPMEQVVEMIRSSELLKSLTASHRTDPNAGHKEATPLFVVAAIVENGKKQSDITRMTGLTMVDLDHVGRERIPELRKRARSDPHTLVFYESISGDGCRVITLYELDDAYQLKQQKQFYPKAFAYANEYYERLMEAKVDEKCKNVGRTSILAYDPEVYFNPSATPFTTEEIKASWQSIAARQAQVKKQSAAMQKIQRLYEETIREEVEADGAVYASGSHNDYVMRVGYKLNQFGIDQDYAVEWAKRQFPEYDKATSVVEACYKANSYEFASRGGRKKNWQEFEANIEEIEAFLKSRIELRRNVISGRVEFKWQDPQKRTDWQPYTDKEENTLWRDLNRTKKVRAEHISRLVGSDAVPDFHPFKDYLDHLPPWDGTTDHIRTLAESVKVRGDESEQDFFCHFLRKWLVAMVAGWIDLKEVNHLILVLIGPQGSYKTTWFNALLPPELQIYFHTKINAVRMAKDDLIALAKYALVCCEELDTMTQRELNNLKASITASSIDERAAYARYSERRKHIASFCGTGNNVQFLTDTTGNRRWLPFEIKSITSPRVKPFNYEGIYAQAYFLYKNDFKYWLEDSDNELLAAHNEPFKVSNAAEELVLSYFGKPTQNYAGEFLTTSEALQQINCNTAHQLSVIQLGRAFSSLGFHSVTYKKRRGFLVVPKTEDARRLERNMLAYKAVRGENTSNDTDDADET